MIYGQIVLGSPGAGKTTYCKSMQAYLSAYDSRRVVKIVNLDPASETTPYSADICIKDVVSLAEVMEVMGLGPNGGLVYCMEWFLEHHQEWLIEKVQALLLQEEGDLYLLFDFPGQVELTSHLPLIKDLTRLLSARLNIQLCAVYLVDVYYCTNANTYLSLLLLTLSAMINLELPHVNVLSKLDLLCQYDENMDFNLSYYCNVEDLSYLIDRLDEQMPKRLHGLHRACCELIESFGLVSFEPFSVKDANLMNNLIRHIDVANGYSHGGLSSGSAQIMAKSIERSMWLQDVAETYQSQMSYPEKEVSDSGKK